MYFMCINSIYMCGVLQGFQDRWQYPHCLGAMDGKHVAIKCPRRSGSLYYNYKGFFSVVMLALVDADYKFLWADVGSNGAASDAQIFNQCELQRAIEDGTIGFPDPEPLPNDDRNFPYFIVGDDAFGLCSWLMKPFGSRHMSRDERIHDYRTSRARRVSENAFGILVNRFGCLLTTMRQHPDTVTSIVIACLCLHNIMRLRYPTMQNQLVDFEDMNRQVVPGAWRDRTDLHNLRLVGGNRATRAAKAQRIYLKEYFVSDAGKVPWQDAMVV